MRNEGGFRGVLRHCGQWGAVTASVALAACNSSPGPAPEDFGELASAHSALTASAGVWTPLPANTVTGASSYVAQLLTDGSLLVQSGSDWRAWSRYKPDSAGNYASGTWSAVPSSVR